MPSKGIRKIFSVGGGDRAETAPSHSQVHFNEGAVRFSDALESDSDASAHSKTTSSIAFRFGRNKRLRRATVGDAKYDQKKRESTSPGSSGVEAAVEVIDDESVKKVVEESNRKKAHKHHDDQQQHTPGTPIDSISECGSAVTTTSASTFNHQPCSSAPSLKEIQDDNANHKESICVFNEDDNDDMDKTMVLPPTKRSEGESEIIKDVKPTAKEGYSVDSMLNLMHQVFKHHQTIPLKQYRFWTCSVLVVLTLLIPSFLSGLLWGFYVAAIMFLYFCVSDPEPKIREHKQKFDEDQLLEKIKEESAKEDDVRGKRIYKGWMNILNEHYNPHTFHVNALQTVLVRLDGKLLRISRPATALLKHGFHSDPTLTESEPKMLGQSIYDLTNASIKLRPRRLARRRWFSRKYPICIKLSSMNGEIKSSRDNLAFAGISEATTEEQPKEIETPTESPNLSERHTVVEMGREADGYLSDASSEGSEEDSIIQRSASDANIPASGGAVQRLRRNFPTGPRKRSTRTIILFARCAREKEQWFHRLRKACNKYQIVATESAEGRRRSVVSIPDTVDSVKFLARDYFLYILNALQFNKHLEESLSIQPQTSLEQDNTILMDLGRVKWTEPQEQSGPELVMVANLIASRVFYDFCRDQYWCKAVQNKIQTKLATIHLPYFIDTLELSGFDIGTAIPKINKIYQPYVDEWGVWVDFELNYTGCIKLALETRVNLMRIKKQHDSTDVEKTTTPTVTAPAPIRRYSDSELPESPETSPDEEYGSKLKLNDNGNKEKKKTGKKILNLVDKIASSNIFKEASELKPIRKMMEEISSTRLMLNVEVTELSGTMTINVPAPPSDRLWYSFRRPPKMSVRAVPQVGDRSVVFSTLSDWIENKIVQLLEKNLVLPNMDDTIIPVMSGNELLQGPLNK